MNHAKFIVIARSVPHLYVEHDPSHQQPSGRQTHRIEIETEYQATSLITEPPTPIVSSLGNAELRRAQVGSISGFNRCVERSSKREWSVVHDQCVVSGLLLLEGLPGCVLLCTGRGDLVSLGCRSLHDDLSSRTAIWCCCLCRIHRDRRDCPLNFRALVIDHRRFGRRITAERTKEDDTNRSVPAQSRISLSPIHSRFATDSHGYGYYGAHRFIQLLTEKDIC
ncbi:hypothetical protein G7K_5767-t1 [Saitoella complicata NRRL Y-17804]|uniref:Uncharacterized protein n=1 Tax=Saitoella complicata (strain BCRC 22490 / CBS 7301 / JCM 7358 / NBRC 10748 / NRRL Y-17804) TaxID=698492 RepID=A0A0E9NPB2_SAICN|nr:hypothetical protein G7K_5767-t1 [Saitoella complicata NRRL Y-17804]